MLATALFVCLAVMILLFENSFHNDLPDADVMRLFHRSIGGLGTGSSAAPAWNLVHFDMRLQSVDDSNIGPIPGSYPYSPAAIFTSTAPGDLQQEDLKIIRIEQ